MVLGIVSIVFGCIGLVCGIIGLVLACKGMNAYNENPEKYDGMGMLKAGKVTSIIGIVLGSISIIYFVFVIMILGTTMGTLGAAGFFEALENL